MTASILDHALREDDEFEISKDRNTTPSDR
jgi:hypothetical protein